MKRLFKGLFNKVTLGIVVGIFLTLLTFTAANKTSTDSFCQSCHVHPQAAQSWKRSSHYDNQSGVVVHCIDCHLPPEGVEHYWVKLTTGLRDLFGTITKDPEEFNWDERSQLDHAVQFTFKASCSACHANLFPLGLSKKGDEAHLYYSRHEDELRCINCHLHVGHYDKDAEQSVPFGLPAEDQRERFSEPTLVEGFDNYIEKIPDSFVSFEMVAIEGGSFFMGGPADSWNRKSDEGPPREVKINPFWMGKAEVSWDEYEAFYRQTATEGRTDTRRHLPEGVDAVTGATPPYGNPDQGWGRDKRPAITMTHHAATIYCRWLSSVTGKNYRLPTEAEWEYACSAGTQGLYFFGGDPGDYSEEGLWNQLFGPDLDNIDPYAVFKGNSRGKTHPPSRVKPNAFGLVHMSGNVREFCLDWYEDNPLARYPANRTIENPQGPEKGTEHVIRGGSFKTDALWLQSAARDHTRHDTWLMTDPQMPKSIWWYSDCYDVGFRVVCEYDPDMD